MPLPKIFRSITPETVHSGAFFVPIYAFHVDGINTKMGLQTNARVGAQPLASHAPHFNR